MLLEKKRNDTNLSYSILKYLYLLYRGNKKLKVGSNIAFKNIIDTIPNSFAENKIIVKEGFLLLETFPRHFEKGVNSSYFSIQLDFGQFNMSKYDLKIILSQNKYWIGIKNVPRFWFCQ